MNNKQAKQQFRVLIDGFDLSGLRFDSVEDAEKYIEENNVHARAQYDVRVCVAGALLAAQFSRKIEKK